MKYILFTDLKESTQLYDKAGDINAYNLVQEHFNLLKHSTRHHSGAIIKTIGDAIMATFSKPQDCLFAAIDMVNKIQLMNQQDRDTDHDIAIKVGMHTGTVLAVTANDTLDYFGQTVNIAARVQGLAEGNEIWITEPCYQMANAESIFNEHRYSYEKKSALLKGVRDSTVVYQCQPSN